MNQQRSSAYTRLPESSRFRSSKADSEDDFEDDFGDDLKDGLRWLEHDLHGYYDQSTSDSRGRHDLANNDMDEYRHDRASRSQPPWRESFYDTHTASHSSSTAIQTRLKDILRSPLPSWVSGKKTDGLLKAVRKMLATGRRKHIPKRSSLSSDMKNLSRHPEERREEDDEEVDVEDHDWVVNLEEMQTLLVELQEKHNHDLEKMVEMKLHISTNIELSKQEAAMGKRPAFLEPIMESLRKEVKGSGYPRLPTLTDAPRTGG